MAYSPDLRLPIIEFFSTQYQPRMVMEEAFSRVIRSIEIWHRRSVGGEYMPNNDFQVLLEHLRKTLTGEAKRLALMRLRYGNELTAKQRLDQVVAASSPELVALVGSYYKFWSDGYRDP